MKLGPALNEKNLVFGFDTGRNPSSGFDHRFDKRRYFKGRPTDNKIETDANYILVGTIITDPSSYPIPIPRGVKFINGTRQNALSWTDTARLDFSNTIAAGTTITASGWYLPYSTDPSIVMNSTNRIQFWSSIGSSADQYQPTQWNKWHRFKFSQTLSANATQIRVEDRGYDYYNSANASLTSQYMLNLQIEVGNSTPSPFSDGSRSSTNSLIDFTKTNTLDVSTLSFDSTGLPTFDGTDDYIDLNTDILTSGGSYTLNAWLKPNGSSWGNNAIPLYNSWPGNSNVGGIWHHFGHDNVLRWRHGGPSYSNGDLSGIGLVADTWQMTTISWDGTTLRLYKNGAQTNSTTAPGAIVSGNSGGRIGRLDTRSSGTLYAWNGQIEAHTVYNRALTPREVKAKFNQHKNRFNL